MNVDGIRWMWLLSAAFITFYLTLNVIEIGGNQLNEAIATFCPWNFQMCFLNDSCGFSHIYSAIHAHTFTDATHTHTQNWMWRTKLLKLGTWPIKIYILMITLNYVQPIHWVHLVSIYRKSHDSCHNSRLFSFSFSFWWIEREYVFVCDNQ